MNRGTVNAVAFVVAGAALACSQPAHPTPSASPSAVAPVARTDYVVFVQKSFESTVAPLVALREREGHGVLVQRLEDVYAKAPSSEPRAALRDEIGRVAKAHPELRFVLLAGDPQSEGTPLPAFTHTLGPWAAEYAGHTYVSDDDYALAASGGHTPLAVGRLPARSAAELGAMVSKIVAYASGPPGPWQRRVGVFAGPVGLGDFDSVVEDYAADVLNGNVPYAFDLRVMFASPSSPYAFGFDRFRDEMISSLGRGSLMSVFAGHASETELSGVRWRGKRWPIGDAADFAKIDASASNPILVVLTCESGAYDMKSGRSIAESAILAPHGPIAVYAAAAVSSAMVNFGWAESLIDAFLVKRSTTVGDGIVDARTTLPSGGSALGLLATMTLDDLDAQDGPDARKEHLAIYNLFGDPGTMPRYPKDAPIHVPASAAPSAPVTITIDAPPGDADLEVTVETTRKERKPGGVPASELEGMPLDQAFDAMSSGNAIANDKVVSRVTSRGAERPLRITVEAPAQRGSYWIKVGGVVAGAQVSGAAALRVD